MRRIIVKCYFFVAVFISEFVIFSIETPVVVSPVETLIIVSPVEAPVVIPSVEALIVISPIEAPVIVPPVVIPSVEAPIIVSPVEAPVIVPLFKGPPLLSGLGRQFCLQGPSPEDVLGLEGLLGARLIFVLDEAEPLGPPVVHGGPQVLDFPEFLEVLPQLLLVDLERQVSDEDFIFVVGICVRFSFFRFFDENFFAVNFFQIFYAIVRSFFCFKDDISYSSMSVVLSAPRKSNLLDLSVFLQCCLQRLLCCFLSEIFYENLSFFFGNFIF